MIPVLGPDTPFPDPNKALHDPNGLLAAGGDLSPGRLLDAYRRGIFPWFSEGEPILWWSPSQRMVMYPGEFHPGRSLRKVLRNKDYEVRVDTAFDRVVRACAEPRSSQSGTWINHDMQRAYGLLHNVGHAHSFETWMGGQLVGGLYGVALGGIFYGESMFSRATDGSKIAFAHLCAHLHLEGFELIDCQMYTSHLERLGARELPRREFLQEVQRLAGKPHAGGLWTLNPAAIRDLPWRATDDHNDP